MRDECIGIPPRFHCEYCPSKFRRKYHLVRHLSSKHGIPKILNTQSVTLTHLPSPHQQQHSHLLQPKIENLHQLQPKIENFPINNPSDTDNENMEIPNANILIPSHTMTPSSNVDRFSVDALMMKQEMPLDINNMVPLDFSHAATEDNTLDPNKIQSDITLRTFQNLKYLFTNFAMNNVPNFTST